jgi:AraC-like DNA-binding protein
MHAFTESIGIPIRPYLAWLKVQRATFAIVSGEPLARAAPFAGFSDAAHMSRSFRRMLGMPPSVLMRARQPADPSFPRKARTQARAPGAGGIRGAARRGEAHFVEQWVTFPRLVLGGGFARAWRQAGR